MAFRSSTRGPSAGGTSVSITPPTGNAAGDIVLVSTYCEGDFDMVVPDGTWTEKVNLPGAPSSSQGHMQLFWKRLATSESTNWVFTRADTTYIEGNAFCFSGRIGTGDPFEASSTQTVASGTSLALPSITASTGADLVAIGENFNYTAWTPPSGMTEAHDFGEVTGMAYAANVTAGATGVKTLTAATGAPMKGFLGSILPAGDGRGRSSNFTGAAVVRASRW